VGERERTARRGLSVHDARLPRAVEFGIIEPPKKGFNMKSLAIKAAAWATISILALSTPSWAATEIRMALTDPIGSTVYRAMTDVFKRRVEELTKGQITVTLFPNSQLGTYKEALEQIHGGVLTSLYESIGTIAPWNPIAGIESVPYLYKDERAFFQKWRSPAGHELLDQLAKNSGFRLVGPAFRGFRVMSTNQKVEKVEDVAGMKLRVPAIKIYMDTWKAFGANPTPLAFEEVFTAIQQGVVAGQENPVTVIYDNHFDEVCKYLILTNHAAETVGAIFNESWWQKLPPENRHAIETAATETSDWLRDFTRQNESRQIDQLRAKGMTLIKPDISGFVARGKTVSLDPELAEWVKRLDAVEP
jgi:TRAP-type transport system periplasmic protein